MKEVLYIFIALVYNGPVAQEKPSFNPDLIKFEKVTDLTLEQCQAKVKENMEKFGTVFCIEQAPKK